MPTCTKFTAEEDDCSSSQNLSGVVLDNTKFTCKIYNFGAHVVSWRSKSDLEVYKTKPEFLFLSEKAILDGTKAIRGGIPICFPQFGKLGECTNQHGFARNATWDFVDSEVDAAREMAKATFTTSSTEETLKEFPYKFTLKYTVTIEKEFLKPMIQQILDQMYPYFMWMGLFFMSMFIFIILILFLNLKVLFYA